MMTIQYVDKSIRQIVTLALKSTRFQILFFVKHIVPKLRQLSSWKFQSSWKFHKINDFFVIDDSYLDMRLKSFVVFVYQRF